MSRQPRLNWDPSRKNWRVRYKGRTYRFSGGKGKSDRYAKNQAKADWTLRRAEIDLEAIEYARHCAPGYDDCLRGWEAVQEHGRTIGDQHLVDHATDQIEDLRTELQKGQPRALETEDFHPATIPIETHEESMFADYQLYGATTTEQARAMDYLWRRQVKTARARLDSGRSTSEIQRNRRSLRTNIDNFLIFKRRQVESGELSATRAEMLLRHCKLVLEHFDEGMDVTDISGKELVEFRQFCVSGLNSGKLSESTARDASAAFKQFISWMYKTEEVIDKLPRNFNDKALAIPISQSEPKTLSVDQLSSLLEDATPRTELYILLGLNCGYRQTDIASIRPQEVDWENGTISRKRTKTRKKIGTPSVTYKLWPRTFELLKNEGVKTGERVLLSASGSPLVSKTLREDGKTKKLDAINSSIKRLASKTEIRFSMCVLRSTAATILRSSVKYTTLVDLFLGHAPRSIADKHYAGPPTELLAEATDWLRQELQIKASHKP